MLLVSVKLRGSCLECVLAILVFCVTLFVLEEREFVLLCVRALYASKLGFHVLDI